MIEAPGSPNDFVYALAAAGDLTFAACESGLYRSDDGAVTWHSAYAALQANAPLSTTALALSPDFTQDKTLYAAIAGSILRSIDGAQSWNLSPLFEPPLPEPPLISALVISPAYRADGFVLATSFTHGVFYSVDQGSSWYTGNYALLDHRILTAAISPRFAQDRTVLIGTETGVFSSSNGGRSWNVADLPYIAATSVAFDSDDTAYAGTDGDGQYISHDKGLTWTRSGLDTTLSISLTITASTSELLVFAGEMLYRSLNAGATWTSLTLRATVTAAALLSPARLLLGYADGTLDILELSS